MAESDGYGRTTWRKPYHLAMICVEVNEAVIDHVEQQLDYPSLACIAATEVCQTARAYLLGSDVDWGVDPAGWESIYNMDIRAGETYTLDTMFHLVELLVAHTQHDWAIFDQWRNSCLGIAEKAIPEIIIERISTKWMIQMLREGRGLDEVTINAATAAWRAGEFLLAADLLDVDAITRFHMQCEIDEGEYP